MKKFILKGILFITLIIFVDFIIGGIFNHLSLNAKSGGNLKNNHIAYNMNEEILIMGSSRAAHHYKPEIFSDSLNMSCYNCGRDGNGIILMYGRWKLLQQRYTPKVIIYDVLYDFDLKTNDNIKYTADLKKYFNNTGIRSIIKNISYTECIKMGSNMYRHNSTVINTIGKFINKESDVNNGYLPMYKKIKIIPEKKENIEQEISFDEIKLLYLEKLIKECQGKTQLFFTISPFYLKQEGNDRYAPIKKLCEKYGVPFIEYDDDIFYENKDLFSDSIHLNDEGATLYSQMIAHFVKEYLSNN